MIAARLRKDATTSTEQEHEELVEILAQILHSKIDAKIPSPTEINRMVCVCVCVCVVEGRVSVCKCVF